MFNFLRGCVAATTHVTVPRLSMPNYLPHSVTPGTDNDPGPLVCVVADKFGGQFLPIGCRNKPEMVAIRGDIVNFEQAEFDVDEINADVRATCSTLRAVPGLAFAFLPGRCRPALHGPVGRAQPKPPARPSRRSSTSTAVSVSTAPG